MNHKNLLYSLVHISILTTALLLLETLQFGVVDSKVVAADRRCIRRGMVRCPVRGDAIPWHQTNVPYILSPRRTRLLNAQPVLRWWDTTQGKGGGEYRVVLKNELGEIVFGPTVVRESQVNLDIDLLPGKYHLQVVDLGSGESSSQERLLAAGTGFEVVSPRVRDGILAELEIQFSDPIEKEIAAARLLLKEGFLLEGIELLDALPAEAQDAELMLEIADVYWSDIALVYPAQRYYQRALDLAEPNSLTAAEAMVGLGRSAQVLAELSVALDWLRQARDVYQIRQQREDIQFIERLIQEVEELVN